MSRTHHAARPEQLVLYRFFGADGELLYIGKSVQAWARLASHCRDSGFYRDAESVTLQRGFKSEAALAAAEVAAIRAEKPRFNYQHNTKLKPPVDPLRPLCRAPSEPVLQKSFDELFAEAIAMIEAMDPDTLRDAMALAENVGEYHQRRSNEFAEQIRAMGYTPDA